MKDKVFLKTKDDGLWKKNPHLAFAIYFVVYLIAFFGSMSLYIFGIVTGWFLTIWLILLTSGLIILTIYLNETRNVSKSIGFVKRDGVLYLIQLSYALGIDENMIYMSSGSAGQAATLPHNIKVAVQTQNAEKEVIERRKKPQSFVNILDYKLNVIKQKNYFPKGCASFIILENPKIVKENKSFIWISYEKDKKRNIKKVRNAYDGLVEEIKKA